MNIAFLAPLRRAWNRMVIALFKPFDLHKWFVVGFTAFLAGLLDGNHGGGGSSSSRGRHGDFDFRDFLNIPATVWNWLTDHPGWFIAIIFIAFFITVLVIVLTWLSSRGRFMFLDNVVHDKAEIANPWKNYSKEGNSLFLWRVVFGLICFILIVLFFIFFFVTAGHLYGSSFPRRIPVLFIIQMVFVFLFMVVILGYISMFLKNFVVPIMYKQRISATRAWGHFLTIFKGHPFHFLGFGLLAFVLTIAFVIAVVLAGLLTCCIGFLLLIIPYIGTVVTLPIWYTYRAFSVEFLAQFGPNYELFPPEEAIPAK